jgi:SNF family Na+-dependent transporter
MLAIGGLLISLYTAIVWGWASFRDESNRGSARVRVTPLWKPFVLVLIPAAVAAVLIAGL